MPGNIGVLEIVIVLVIALIVFGPKRLPELGSSLGRGIREFKETVTGDRRDDDDEEEIDDDVKALSASQATAPPEGADSESTETEPARDRRP